MTSRFLAAGCVLGVLALSGCPSADPGIPDRDANRNDAGTADGGGSTPDTGPRLDTGVMRDGGVHCATGQHVCGGGCITDQPNDPANGCRLGCGTACPAPAMGVASCTTTGMCDFTCPSPSHRVGDTCVCTPHTCEDIGYHCGAPDDGCGMPLDCGTCGTGAMCLMGVCGCMPDSHEDNDDNSSATPEAELTDSADPTVTLTDFTIDHMGDQDWIHFHVVDAFDGGNPHVYVRLYNIPSGSDFDLGAWYACDNSNNNSSCTVGTADNMIGRGCVSSHPGIAEENIDLPTNCGFAANSDGNLYIRVTAPTFGGSCMPYALEVRVR